MTERINLMTVCTDAYHMIYARKLIKRFCELTDFIVQPYCITDRPLEIDDIAEPLEAHYKGWWNKCALYNERMPAGWNVYLDIDNVLIKNFDDVIEFAIKKNKKMAMLSDSIMWMDNKYCSSFMIYETGRMHDIYERFTTNYEKIKDFKGGDQVWTGRYVKDHEICYLDEEYDNKFKQNLKFNLAKRVMGHYVYPEYILNSVKIIDCGGRPKPHELEHLKYIKENWHEVDAT